MSFDPVCTGSIRIHSIRFSGLIRNPSGSGSFIQLVRSGSSGSHPEGPNSQHSWMLNLVRVAMMSRGTELTSLPKFHLVELSIVNYRFDSECRFQDVDHKLGAIFLGQSCFEWLRRWEGQSQLVFPDFIKAREVKWQQVHSFELSLPMLVVIHTCKIPKTRLNWTWTKHTNKCYLTKRRKWKKHWNLLIWECMNTTAFDTRYNKYVHGSKYSNLVN